MLSEIQRRLALLGRDLVRLRAARVVLSKKIEMREMRCVHDAEVLRSLIHRLDVHVVVSSNRNSGTRIEASDDFDESATRLDLVSNRDG